MIIPSDGWETEARMLGDLPKARLAPKLLLLIYPGPELSYCGIRMPQPA